MIAPRAPIHLTHSRLPRVEDFARLAALEAGVRGTLLSAMPLSIYRALGDAVLVSGIYFCVGLISLAVGLLVPALGRKVPRRWLFTAAGCAYLVGLSLAILGGPVWLSAALLINAMGTVTYSVCFQAYVLDYIARNELGRNESVRMVYSALPWAVGPLAGIWMLNLWSPLPFLVAGIAALAMIAVFWRLRLGSGKQITRARAPAPNPLAYLGRFFRQPRLIAGWLFAVIRSCGWWVYVVYLPIFCIEAGLGETIGGAAVSGANALLLTTPWMLARVKSVGVRSAVRGTFALCGLLFMLGFVATPVPMLTVLCLALGAACLVMLDVCGGLPFLMAVKPSERTEMAAVYASYRDVSGILTPAAAWLVLLAFPVAGVFAACGAAMFTAAVIARRLHPRLGLPREESAASA